MCRSYNSCPSWRLHGVAGQLYFTSALFNWALYYRHRKYQIIQAIQILLYINTFCSSLHTNAKTKMKEEIKLADVSSLVTFSTTPMNGAQRLKVLWKGLGTRWRWQYIATRFRHIHVQGYMPAHFIYIWPCWRCACSDCLLPTDPLGHLTRLASSLKRS
jgi:hypothetical protein